MDNVNVRIMKSERLSGVSGYSSCITVLFKNPDENLKAWSIQKSSLILN